MPKRRPPRQPDPRQPARRFTGSATADYNHGPSEDKILTVTSRRRSRRTQQGEHRDCQQLQRAAHRRHFHHHAMIQQTAPTQDDPVTSLDTLATAAGTTTRQTASCRNRPSRRPSLPVSAPRPLAVGLFRPCPSTISSAPAKRWPPVSAKQRGKPRAALRRAQRADP